MRLGSRVTSPFHRRPWLPNEKVMIRVGTICYENHLAKSEWSDRDILCRSQLNFGRLRERGWCIVLRSPHFTTIHDSWAAWGGQLGVSIPNCFGV
jgi:hypothetical protein